MGRKINYELNLNIRLQRFAVELQIYYQYKLNYKIGANIIINVVAIQRRI